MGENIINYINKINLLVFNRQKELLFKENRELILLTLNIKKIALNRDGFNKISNFLYQGIYESSGADENKLYFLTKYYQIDDKIIDKIKYFRNFFDHELSNNPKKSKEILNYIDSIINRKIPSLPSEWIKVQLQFYIDLESMLKRVYDKLNNDKNDQKLEFC